MSETGSKPLGPRLRELRLTAKMIGAVAAEKAGVHQSTISRVETGSLLPTPELVSTLCDVYEVPDAERHELVETAIELREERTTVRVVLGRGAWLSQQRLLRAFCPSVVHELLRTAGYSRALLSGAFPSAEVERRLAARTDMERTLAPATAPLEGDRQFVFWIAEGALRWNVGGPAVMAEQLDLLIDVSARPNVEIGVIPWTTRVGVPAVRAFSLLDSVAVAIDTERGTSLLSAPHEVTEHEAYWSDLARYVARGDEARATLKRIADEYRAHPMA